MRRRRRLKRVFGVRGIANDLEVKPSSMCLDPEIARDVVHDLQSHVSIPADQIKVTVQNGWVPLEGTVEWQYQKSLAEAAVKKLRGVIGVTNNIQVKARVSPTEIKSKIEESVKRSAELDARRDHAVGRPQRPNEFRSRCLPRNIPAVPNIRSHTRTRGSCYGRRFRGLRNAEPERNGR
jgi:hypothetical protein